ncbi:protein FAM166B-like [Condylostylus longicornis]|uniref:protein FAM166B-like n=1 Tax=Condylostylus longicornis TaxID=2530218 RepID=UPI00244DC67F|nr:protein FAM166B-like [Condylostylus longicornis]
MLSEISTSEPHFIPGYTGFCPQYKFRIGETYGNLTHKLLLDTSTTHSENIIITTDETYKYLKERPTLQEINLVKEHENSDDPLYKYSQIPGYCGFIPFSNNKIGARYSIITTEGIAEFEKYLPYSKHYPPHFMEDDDPRKFLKSGYAGWIPFEWTKIGKNDNSALCEFTKYYKLNQHYRRIPITIETIISKPKNNFEKYEIYIKDKGMIPNYTGHVPGERFEIGKSYGKSTLNAKNKLYC